tara:strand:+ start:1740 stop:2387 length:648 start_codon:yes stop_codon:yes gene_type:complete
MTMKRLSSLTTTLQKGQSLKISAEAIDTGVTTDLSGTQKAKAIARLIEVNNPAVIDKNLVSSVESLTKSKVNKDIQVRYPIDKDPIFTTRKYELVGYDNLVLEDVERALEVVSMSLIALPTEELKQRLTVLATLLIKPSQETSTDVGIRIKSLATELAKFPADLVIYAIEQVKNSHKFWPSFAEFYQHIKWRMDTRQHLYACLYNKRLELTAITQ